MARDYDGDITKFVQGKKPRDEAQKWRAFKNISRMWKNPIGYLYWKTDVFAKNNRIRFLYINLFYMLYQTWLTTALIRSKKTTLIDHWRYQTGQVNDNYVM